LLTGRKLLLADDSVTIQKVVSLTFGDEGMQVTTVSDGEQALAKLEEIAPDIVLADVHMPKVSGYQVCEQIRRDERFRHLPVMLLVGSFEPFDEEEARRVGADDHLTKPFQSIRQLVSKVGSLLSGSTPQEEADTQRLPSLADAEERPAHPARTVEEPISAEVLEVTTANTAPLPSLPQSEAQQQERDEQSNVSDAGAGERTIGAARSGDFKAEEETDSAAQLDQYDALPVAAREETAETVQAHASEMAPQEQDAPQPFNLEESHEPAYAPAGGGPQLNFGAKTDDALLDLGDIEPAYSTNREDDFILDLQDEAFYKQPAAAVAAQEPEMAAPAERADMLTPALQEEEMSEAVPRALEFSEVQLAGEEQRAQFASVEVDEPPQEYASPEMLQESHAGEAGPLTTATAQTEASSRSSMAVAQEASAAPASSASAQTGQISLDQLSPEVIDAIARRAVEYLSEKAVQEIAWEVVPQLAELLIKRRLEEERTQAK
jgi:CheY-like chemotaxis protein